MWRISASPEPELPCVEPKQLYQVVLLSKTKNSAVEAVKQAEGLRLLKAR